MKKFVLPFLIIILLFSLCIIFTDSSNASWINANMWYWASMISYILIMKQLVAHINPENIDKRFGKIIIGLNIVTFFIFLIIFVAYVPRSIINFISYHNISYGEFLEAIGPFSFVLSSIILIIFSLDSEFKIETVSHEVHELQNKRHERAVEMSYWATTIGK